MFNIQGGTIHISRFKVSPCPNCGGVGHIPDGIYQKASARLFNESDLETVLKALNALREHAQQGASTDQIKEEIKVKYPFLKSLSGLLPKDAKDLAAYLTLLVLLISQCSSQKHDVPLQPVQIEVHISSAIEGVASDLKTSQPKSQEPHKGPL